MAIENWSFKKVATVNLGDPCYVDVCSRFEGTSRHEAIALAVSHRRNDFDWDAEAIPIDNFRSFLRDKAYSISADETYLLLRPGNFVPGISYSLYYISDPDRFVC